MNADEKPDPKHADETFGAEGAEVEAKILAANAVDAVQKAVDELTELLRDHVPEAISALKEASKAAGENIGDLARDIKDDASEIGRVRLDELSVAVRRNPVAALAIAAGVGLILGLWNSRGGRS